MSNATELAADEQSSCALLSDGHVACWGLNESGQLGDGTSPGPETCSSTVEGRKGKSEPLERSCSKVPLEVQGIANAVGIAGSSKDMCAVLSTGLVDCWGDNEQGQLGDGTSSGPEICQSRRPGGKGGTETFEYPCSTVPIEVQGIANATGVAVGDYHACAVLSTGHVDCWETTKTGHWATAKRAARSTIRR